MRMRLNPSKGKHSPDEEMSAIALESCDHQRLCQTLFLLREFLKLTNRRQAELPFTWQRTNTPFITWL